MTCLHFRIDDRLHVEITVDNFYQGTIFSASRGFVAVRDPELMEFEGPPAVEFCHSRVEALRFIIPELTDLKAELAVDHMEASFADSDYGDSEEYCNFAMEDWE